MAAVTVDNKIYWAGGIGSINTTNNTWSTGVLNQKIFDATVISVNNTIYVAGGRETVVGPQGYGGPFLKQVWKLEW